MIDYAHGVSIANLINVNSNATQLQVTTGSATQAGVISETGAVTKSGAATLTLTGANSYSGDTTISAGTLQIGAGGTTPALRFDETRSNRVRAELSLDATDPSHRSLHACALHKARYSPHCSDADRRTQT